MRATATPPATPWTCACPSGAGDTFRTEGRPDWPGKQWPHLCAKFPTIASSSACSPSSRNAERRRVHCTALNSAGTLASASRVAPIATDLTAIFQRLRKARRRRVAEENALGGFGHGGQSGRDRRRPYTSNQPHPWRVHTSRGGRREPARMYRPSEVDAPIISQERAEGPEA